VYSSFVDQYLFAVFTRRIPFVRYFHRLVNDAEVVGKVLLLKDSVLRFEALTSRFLAIAVPTNVCSLQTHSKETLSQPAIANANVS
jgi:hypothetical protein